MTDEAQKLCLPRFLVLLYLLTLIVFRYYNFESSLRDFIHQKWQVEEARANPLASGDFKSMSCSDKVDIVYCLCQSRLNTDDIAETLKVNVIFFP